MNDFKNRVFGSALVKAINSNYNADFSGQPRTLPNGVIYATDKVYKYSIRNYFKDVYPLEKIMYFKSLDENLNPVSLDEKYIKLFGDYPKSAGKDKDKILKSNVAEKLLSCLDIRLFGATFAGKTNISVHGPVQINHGINIWKENNIFSEQISSPFSNKSDDGNEDKGMTTLGRQSKLEEGHYLHHFTINPQNLRDIVELAASGAQTLSDEDIHKLKEAMLRGVTWYDSASKAGCENEMLVWAQLKEDSKIVLPNFSCLIDLKEEKNAGKCVYDFEKLKYELSKFSSDIEFVEIYYNQHTIELVNIPDGAKLETI